MGSHKQRVQRKIKKDVKRKVQAKRTQQRTNAGNNPLTEMMKMMAMMKGDKQPAAAGDNLTDRIRLIEEAQKQKNEKVRIQKEHENEVARMQKEQEEKMNKLQEEYDKQKSEIDKLKRERKEKKQENANENAKNQVESMKRQNKLENDADEIKNQTEDVKRKAEEQRKANAVQRLQEQHDAEQETLYALQQGTTYDEQIAQMEHEKKMRDEEMKRLKIQQENERKRLHVEELQEQLDDANKKAIEVKRSIKELAEINGYNVSKYNDVFTKLDSVIKYTSGNVEDYLKDIHKTHSAIKHLENQHVDLDLSTVMGNHKELANELGQLQSKLKNLETKAKKVEEIKGENEDMKASIKATNKVIDDFNYERVFDPKDGKMKYKLANGTLVETLDGKNKALAKKRDIHTELVNAEQENKELESTKTQLIKSYERNEADVLKIDELGHKKKNLEAYNKEMNKTTYEDKSSEIAKLEYEIKNIQDQINEKYTSKADYNKYLKRIEDLERRKSELEQQLGMIDVESITQEQIKQHAQAENDIANTEADIAKKRSKNAAVDKFEAETDELKLRNDVKQEMLNSMDDKSNEENLKKIVTNRVAAEQKEKQLAAEQEEKDAEEALNIAKWKEEALNSTENEEARNKIKQAYINKAKYEENAKAQERLYNAEVESNNARVMAQVYASLNSSFTASNKLTAAETEFIAARDKFTEVVNDIKDEAEYVHNKTNILRSRLTDDLPFRDKINEVLNTRGYNIDNQDWYGENLKSRDAVNAFSDAADIIRSAYDSDQQTWNDELLVDNENLDKYLNIAGFPVKE